MILYSMGRCFVLGASSVLRTRVEGIAFNLRG
jgi:hypothetical protein